MSILNVALLLGTIIMIVLTDILANYSQVSFKQIIDKQALLFKIEISCCYMFLGFGTLGYIIFTVILN